MVRLLLKFHRMMTTSKTSQQISNSNKSRVFKVFTILRLTLDRQLNVCMDIVEEWTSDGTLESDTQRDTTSATYLHPWFRRINSPTNVLITIVAMREKLNHSLRASVSKAFGLRRLLEITS